MMRTAMLVLVCATFTAEAAPPARRPVAPAIGLPGRGPAKVEPDLAGECNQAPLVFVAKLTEAIAGPVARSWPPIYSFTLRFGKLEMLKGTAPKERTFSYQSRQMQAPKFTVGKRVLVAARPQPAPGRGWVATLILPATDANIAAAKVAALMPVGWKLVKGKAVSPWAALAQKAWPKGAKLTADLKCAKSGRPALLVPAGVTLKVEQIIPKDFHKWRNPYGDGKFTITVTNTTEKPVEVPALLSDGGGIRWADSLLVTCKKRTRLFGGAGRLSKDVKPTKLAAKQSVSTVVNTLELTGFAWPRGGSRVYFTFSLGQLGERNFFYYYSKLHDAMLPKPVA